MLAIAETIAALLLSGSAFGQDANILIPQPTNIVVKPVGPEPEPTPATNDLAQTVKQIASDAYTQFKSASFKDGFTVEPFAIYHRGDWGGGLAISTAATNSINYGFALATIHETENHDWDFYDTSFNVSYNGSVDLPIVGNAQYFIETGAAVDLRSIQTGIYNQSLTGLKKTWDFNGNLSLTIWGGVGYLTKWNDAFYSAGIGLTTRLKGKHFLGIF